MDKQLPPLSEKQTPTLARALTFGFTTCAAEMHYCRYSKDAVNGMLGARVKGGYLSPFTARPGLTGYRATAATCRMFGASAAHARRLIGNQAVLPRLAVLTDCYKRKVLPFRAEDKTFEALGELDYRYVPGETCEVAYIHVDVGTEPRRLLHKVIAQFRRHKADPVFAKLIDEERFSVRILTPTAGKARALMREFGSEPLPGSIEIEVIEEMQPCLMMK